MRLNLNDEIKVKLTEHGKDIYYHQYDRLNTALGREVCKPSYPEVDEGGYTTFQLWCFMELYGVHMGMTFPNVIEPLDIVFDAPTIEPETEEEAYERGYTAGQMAQRKTGHKINQHQYPAKWVCSECGAKHFDFNDKFCSECGVNVEEGD